MTLFKFFPGCIVLILAAVLYFASAAHAEKKTFEKEYTYRASDVDSKVTSRLIALEQVKRMLLEELGTYLIEWKVYHPPVVVVFNAAQWGLNRQFFTLLPAVHRPAAAP